MNENNLRLSDVQQKAINLNTINKLNKKQIKQVLNILKKIK